MQNAVQTWQLMDLPHKYVRYHYPVHVICETWAHWLHSSRLSHTSSYLLAHQDGRHAQKYHGVMQTYIIFHHVMNTLYCLRHGRRNRSGSCLLYGAWKASRCDLRSSKFQKFSALHSDNQLLGRWVSLIALLWNFYVKQTGPLYTMFQILLSFSTLSDLSKVSFIAGKAAS